MTEFEWDEGKEIANIDKHGVSFHEAMLAFDDPLRIIELDTKHSEAEPRFHCYGYAGDDVMTVRFTYRGTAIRIFGAAYWRKGKKVYEKEQKNQK